MLLGQGLFEASFEFVTVKFRNDLFYSWLVDHLQVIDSHVWYMAVSDFGPYFATSGVIKICPSHSNYFNNLPKCVQRR